MQVLSTKILISGLTKLLRKLDGFSSLLDSPSPHLLAFCPHQVLYSFQSTVFRRVFEPAQVVRNEVPVLAFWALYQDYALCVRLFGEFVRRPMGTYHVRCFV